MTLKLNFVSFENVGSNGLCKTKGEVETYSPVRGKKCTYFGRPRRTLSVFRAKARRKEGARKDFTPRDQTHTPASCFLAVITIAFLLLAALIQTATLPSAAGRGQWGTLGRKPPDQERGRGRSDAEELQLSATNQLISQTSSLILAPVSLISARRRHWVTAGLPAALPPHTFIYLSFFLSLFLGSACSISVSRTALNEF